MPSKFSSFLNLIAFSNVLRVFPRLFVMLDRNFRGFGRCFVLAISIPGIAVQSINFDGVCVCVNSPFMMISIADGPAPLMISLSDNKCNRLKLGSSLDGKTRTLRMLRKFEKKKLQLENIPDTQFHGSCQLRLSIRNLTRNCCLRQ